MSQLFIFADEAGCLGFKQGPNISRFFILCTVTMEDTAVVQALIDLRRRLAWEDQELGDFFHASTDRQAVRDAVFREIIKHDFTVQATIMEKAKAQPHITKSASVFYQYAWYYHFKFATKPFLKDGSQTLITSASIGTKKERAAFENAVNEVMRQSMPKLEWKTDFMPAQADPCIQVADYCAWAIQRKWESLHKENPDTRSYDLIKNRITYEYDLWKKGTTTYY
jgi:hypothetical protein